jgi:hypothetical protein
VKTIVPDSVLLQAGESFAAALLAILLIMLVAAALRRRTHPRRTRGPGTPDAKPRPGSGSFTPRKDLRDPGAQMKAISGVGFERQRILNGDEARLLYLLENALKEFGRGHRLFAQTSLGEVLRPAASGATPEACRDAYASINSKRLDFAVIDRYGFLAAAVEFHGGGHHQGTAFMRDAVKREALRKAGVPFIEVEKHYVTEEVRQRLRRAIAPGEPQKEVRRG